MRRFLSHATKNGQRRNIGHRLLVSAMTVVAVASILLASSPVSALTGEQRQAYAYQGITFIDDACQVPGGDDVTITGSINGSPNAAALHSKFNQHVIDAFFFFLGQGFTPSQSAGIVGNLMQESGDSIDPLNTDGVAHGIAQWQGGRLPKMYAWVAANYGGDKNSFIGQLNYIMQELKTDFTTVLSTMKTFATPEEAANYWNHHYEISADTTTKRPDHARAVYTAAVQPQPIGEGWIAAAGGTVVGATNKCGTASTAGCTGDPKILCEAKKYNGIFYSFGAGHAGYNSFKQGCPTDSIVAAAAASTAGKPGPCATDCSSLVSIALDDAFGLKEMWVVSDITDTQNTKWKLIDVAAAQPGDVVTHKENGVGEHIEIVVHYDPKTRVVHTFGSHETGTKTSASSGSTNYYTQAWHWTGQGSQ